VLAGERLVVRVDLKAERTRDALRVVSVHYEEAGASVARRDRHATRMAVDRYAAALGSNRGGGFSLPEVTPTPRRSFRSV
jgi:uncharacterized protein YcaQ